MKKIVKFLVLCIFVCALIACQHARPRAGQLPDVTTDIVVVGGGGAGLTAATKASYLGKNVILLEKTAILGGSTLLATTGLLAVESEVMRRQGIRLTAEDFYNHMM